VRFKRIEETALDSYSEVQTYRGNSIK